MKKLLLSTLFAVSSLAQAAAPAEQLAERYSLVFKMTSADGRVVESSRPLRTLGPTVFSSCAEPSAPGAGYTPPGCDVIEFNVAALTEQADHINADFRVERKQTAGGRTVDHRVIKAHTAVAPGKPWMHGDADETVVVRLEPVTAGS